MDWVSNIAQRAENLLETVDRQAAKTAEEIKGNPQTKVIQKAAETAKRLESRQRYVPRQRIEVSTKPSDAEGTAQHIVGEELKSRSITEEEPSDMGNEGEAIRNQVDEAIESDDINFDELNAGEDDSWDDAAAVTQIASESLLESSRGTSFDSTPSGSSEYKGREQHRTKNQSSSLAASSGDQLSDIEDRSATKAASAEVFAQHAREIEGYKLSIRSLEQEIDKMDGQLIHMQNDLDAAQEALLRSQEVAAEREAALKRQLAARDGDVDMRESELLSAIEERDSQIKELETEIKRLNHAAIEQRAQESEQNARMEALQEELRQAKDLQDLRSSDASEIENQMREIELTMQRNDREHQEHTRDLQRRIAELEHSNSELAYALGEAQRQTEEAETRSFAVGALADESGSSKHGSGQGAKGIEADRNDYELFEANEARQVAENLLAEERQRLQSVKLELDTVTDLLNKSRIRAEEWEQKYLQQANRHESEREVLLKRVSDAETHQDLESTTALEKRLYALTEHLSAKQHAIDEITSEKGALTQRLRNLEKKFKEQQALIQSLQSDNGGFDDDMDVEAGGGLRYRMGVLPVQSGDSMVSLPGFDRGQRRRRGGMKRISRLAVISKYPQLAKFVDFVDKVCYTIGTVLYRQPWARLAFLCYVGLLHLWVFYVLEFHTREMHDKDFMKEVFHMSGGRPTPILPPGMTSVTVKPKI